jgi:hypothetical protein
MRCFNKTVVARIVIIPLLVMVPLSVDARMRLYSRGAEEKRVTDSLKVIDSLRSADSTRIADSCVIARYRGADVDLVKERKRKAEETAKNAPITPDPNDRILSSDDDIISARTVIIDPENPHGKTVDSLQHKVDSLNDALHDSDMRYKNMKAFPISEKKRYLIYLLQNKMKDTSEIVYYCNRLTELYKLKYELLLAIRDSQNANTKVFITSHIEEHMMKMAELSRFYCAMTPAVPFYPERNAHQLISEQ